MSELYREQHPLLCEDLSDDAFSPQFNRRLRPMSFRSRARNNLKGAAAVITRWPDHWSSFLTYWWIGLGMICLMTFFIYNSIFTFPLVPIVRTKSTMSVVSSTVMSTTHSTPATCEVYMHIFVNENEEVDLNEYIPYIEKVSNKYSEFNYNLIVVYNDTVTKGFSDEQNNEMALNLLWDKNAIKIPLRKSKINVKYISLTTYMDDSPLGKYWRSLPHPLIEFLARAVSIWNKGGITFNPNILTPKSSSSIYIEKLRNLLNNYIIRPNAEEKSKITTKNRHHKQKLNNIRDIINALENSDNSVSGISHETLAEAEAKNAPISIRNVTHSFVVDVDDDNKTNMATNWINHSEQQPKDIVNLLENNANKLTGHNENYTESNISVDSSHNSSKGSMLPLLLGFLFHDKQSNTMDNDTTSWFHRARKSAMRRHNENQSLLNDGINPKADSTLEPITVSAKVVNNQEFDNKVLGVSLIQEQKKKFDSNQLTIDLKGNLIATDTPCHAFLGTIFSNAVHHNSQETVTDFIISELSVFCKGLLSSCRGIDLILL